MEVHIDEVVSTVHTVDNEALVSPSVMRQLVQAVMRQVRAERDHERRVRNEQSMNAGRVQSDASDRGAY
jgi:hypothetical protein